MTKTDALHNPLFVQRGALLCAGPSHLQVLAMLHPPWAASERQYRSVAKEASCTLVVVVWQPILSALVGRFDHHGVCKVALRYRCIHQACTAAMAVPVHTCMHIAQKQRYCTSPCYMFPVKDGCVSSGPREPAGHLQPLAD